MGIQTKKTRNSHPIIAIRNNQTCTKSKIETSLFINYVHAREVLFTFLKSTHSDPYTLFYFIQYTYCNFILF